MVFSGRSHMILVPRDIGHRLLICPLLKSPASQRSNMVSIVNIMVSPLMLTNS